MSAFYPPSYSFTGINFNSEFFTTPTTGLTETQANAIYLWKTTPDTASALETFTGGIKTDTVNATNSANILTIGLISAGTTVNQQLTLNYTIAPIAGQIGYTYYVTNGDLGRNIQGDWLYNGAISYTPMSPIYQLGFIYFHVNLTLDYIKLQRGFRRINIK